MLPIVLASASPRRIGLLRQIGLDPRVIPADIDEHIQWDDPVQAVQGLACRKARDVGERSAKDTPGQDMWILGADTVVVYKGQILGKPVDKKEAVRMLDALQGDTHSVFMRWRCGRSRDMWTHWNPWIKRVPMRYRGSLQNISAGSAVTTTMWSGSPSPGSTRRY